MIRGIGSCVSSIVIAASSRTCRSTSVVAGRPFGLRLVFGLGSFDDLALPQPAPMSPHVNAGALSNYILCNRCTLVVVYQPCYLYVVGVAVDCIASWLESDLHRTCAEFKEGNRVRTRLTRDHKSKKSDAILSNAVATMKSVTPSIPDTGKHSIA